MQTSTRGDPCRPGGLSPQTLVARILRVDHAGEYGAARIYDGQLAVLGAVRRVAPTTTMIRQMAMAERRHLASFERLLNERRVRPTLLAPLWDGLGFALGAVTALLGERAALACTAAIEEEIDRHYAGQIARLGADEAPLRDLLQDYRADELAHRDTALANGAAETPGYALLNRAIRFGCRLAIRLSERI